MKGYPSVLTMMLAAIAFLALSEPGVAEDHVQFFVPAMGPVVLRFAAIDPARGAIDQHRLLQEIKIGRAHV